MVLVHSINRNLIYGLLHAAAAAAKSLQSCPTLCDPTDGSPPGSSVLGILQARILEWVAVSFSNAREKTYCRGTSLVAQWLRLLASKAGGSGSILG